MSWKRRRYPAASGNLRVRGDAQRVVGIELQEKRPAADGLVLLADRRGGSKQRAEATEEPTIVDPRPPYQACSAPSFTAEAVESTVVGDARKSVGRDRVAVVKAPVAETGPRLEEGGMAGRHALQGAAPSGVVIHRQRRAKSLNRAVGLRCEHGLVACGGN